MTEYGTAVLRATYDLDGYVSKVEVVRADRAIGVSPGLLDGAQRWVFPNGDRETIQLDTAGEYLYRRVGPAEDEYVIVFERIEP